EYGRARSSTALVTVKMAVLAAIPKARVTIAARAKPGFLRSVRAPKRRSCHKVSIQERISHSCQAGRSGKCCFKDIKGDKSRVSDLQVRARGLQREIRPQSSRL